MSDRDIASISSMTRPRMTSAAFMTVLFGSLSTAHGQPATRKTVVFTGMCDASGAVSLSDRLFAVADDEDNVVRIYDADTGGAPVALSDLSASLNLPEKRAKKPKKKPPKHPRRAPETDVEAATRLGDTALWLTSHGRTESGKLKSERFRFFATTATSVAGRITVIGEPYEHLADDLIASPKLAGLGLDRAARLPAKEGGLNIEGMTARPGGGVIIGLRSPLSNKRAILVPIENPLDVMRGRPVTLGAAMLLDLGGGGVRAISWWRGGYWIVAGGPDGGSSRLFAWNEGSAPRQVPFDARDINPEAFFSPEDRGEMLILSDDGEREIEGERCKRLRDRASKRFRGVWIKPS